MNFFQKTAAILMSAVLTASALSAGSISVSAEAQILLNDTFEEGYGSWKGVGATAEISDTTSHGGTRSLYISGREKDWNAPRCSIAKLIDSGRSYDFSTWVYYDDESTGGQSQNFSIQYVYTDTDGNERYGWVGQKNVQCGEWTEVTGTNTIPEGATGVTIYVQAATLSDFYIDDVSLTGEPSTKTSTEDGFSDNFDEGKTMGWTGRGSATVEISEKTAHSAPNSLFTQGRTQLWNGAVANKNDVITPGGYYSFGCWVYYEGDEWSDTQKFSINLQYDADGKENYYTIYTETAVKGQWTYVGSEITVPSNGTNFFVYVQTGYTSAPKEQDLMDFYVDDIEAVRLPDPAIQEDITSLKEAYADYFKLGCAATESELENKATKDLIRYQYNSLTLGNELKPDSVLDQSASISYAQKNGDYTNPQISLKKADKLLSFAAENNIPVRGHVLCWHSQTPDWFFKEDYTAEGDWVSPEVMNKRLENYIKNIMTALAEEYPDVNFYAWDVVNEAASDAGTIREAGSNNEVNGQSAWVKVYGDQSYILKAFEYAKKYAPQGTKLFYNDYNEYNPTKQAYIISDILTPLVEAGLIDGMGMQSHISESYPTVELYKEAIQKYADLGLEIQITELDVSEKSNSTADQLKLARRYQDVFKMYKELKDSGVNISAVVLWGITDSTSWIGGYPLLFDKNYQAKPAFYAVADTGSEIKEIKQAIAYKNDGTEDDIEAKLALVNEESIGSSGSFKVTSNGKDKVTVKIYPSVDGVYEIIVSGEASFDSGEVKTTKDEVVTYTLTMEDADFAFPLDFDIRINDDAWNDIANFENKTDAVTGQILLKDQPAYGEAVKGSPVIDGEIDELWQKANTFEVNNQQVGSDGATATGRVLWDENNIYVLMEVRDSLLSDKSTNAYEQDCVEVFLDENNHKSSSYEADDIQARVNFNNFKTVTDTLSTDAFTSAAKKTENGYIVEIALPSTLGGFGADQLVGFDLQVNDDADGDGKRDNVTIWNDLTGMGYADPSVFGLLRLAGDGTEPKVTTTAPYTDITTTTTTAKPGPIGDFIYGDVDLNGEVGVTDVILLNKVLTGSANLSDTAVAAANVDLNTEVNGLDANYIMQFLINARTLPVKQ